MKTLRLAEVLLPLLAARGWAPWPIEPGVRVSATRAPAPAAPHSRTGRHDDPDAYRVPFDDVQ